MLQAWTSSPATVKWQSNPDSPISSDLRGFLCSLLVTSECVDKTTRTRCANMEGKPDYLVLPGGENPTVVKDADADVLSTIFAAISVCV